MPVSRGHAVSVKKIQALDRTAIEKIGIPSVVLMENAGRLVAEEVIRQIKIKKSGRVCVFCGQGNNAGDGFVAARYLLKQGIKTRIFLIGKAKYLKRDAALHYDILKRLRYPLKEIVRVDKALLDSIAKSDILIDAIFGVGLNRDILNPFKDIIHALNSSKKPIISIDIPSGLDGTSGRIYGACIKATTTVTFSFMKKGFFENEGPRHTGRIVVTDIGIPEKLLKEI